MSIQSPRTAKLKQRRIAQLEEELRSTRKQLEEERSQRSEASKLDDFWTAYVKLVHEAGNRFMALKAENDRLKQDLMNMTSKDGRESNRLLQDVHKCVGETLSFVQEALKRSNENGTLRINLSVFWAWEARLKNLLKRIEEL